MRLEETDDLRRELQHFISRERKICWEAEFQDGEYAIGEHRVKRFVEEIISIIERRQVREKERLSPPK